MRIRPWLILGLLTGTLLGTGLESIAQHPKSCSSCEEPITGPFFWFKSPALKGQRALCKPCSQISQRCFQCDQPSKKGFRKLPDGRFLCREHGPQAIVTPRQALETFEQTKRHLFPILNGMGRLPSANVKLQLVDATAIAKLYPEGQKTGKGEFDTMGLTQTRGQSWDKQEHTIYLISGLTPTRFMAVAAHEYAHVWVHENVPPTRKIDKNTVEAFCELVAFRLMDAIHEEEEKKVILQNAYTKGQIDTLLKANDAYRFYNVVKWMKQGQKNQIDEATAREVLAVGGGTPQGTVHWIQPIKTQVPDQLTLKGISGTKKRRFALINNETLMANEVGRVRVGDSEVLVKCLEIRENSVLIQIDGEVTPKELKLGRRR